MNLAIREVMEGIIDTDVLVVGGGLAGCRAALRAKDFCDRVTLVDKAVLGRSGASFWDHETLAPVPEGTFTAWMRELVEQTEFLCDQRAVEVLLRETAERLKELEDWGVPFKRDQDGSMVTGAGRGMMDHCRSVYFDGRFWFDRVRNQVIAKGVSTVKRVMVTDLLTSDGQHPTQGHVVGALGMDTVTGEVVAFRARAVVLTTGLISTKVPTGRVDNLTGEGQAMAFRVGAELANMEFCLGEGYFPILKKKGTPIPSLIQFQTLGGFVVNQRGDRIMEKYLPGRMERGSGRGPLARALVKEVLEGRGPLYFDMRHWTDEKVEMVRRVIPLTMARLADAGIDIRKDRIPFTVITTGFSGSGNGGIRVGIDGETNIGGLFAAGAVAKARSQTEALSGSPSAGCNVFGHRAGENAARWTKEAPEPTLDTKQVQKLGTTLLEPIRTQRGPSPQDVYMAVNRKLLPWRYSIFKHESRIKEALEETEQIEREDAPRLSAKNTHDLVKAHEVRSLVLMAKLYHVSSLYRKESRCKHYREEYPYRDDVDWLGHTVLKRDRQRIALNFEPLPVEDYPIKLDRRERVPTPVKYSFP